MNIWATAFVTLLCLMPVSALAEFRVDGSSQANFESSIKEMSESLSEQDREIFQKGLMNLIVTEYPPAKGQTGVALFAFMEPAVKAARTTLDGFTLAAILERGREAQGDPKSDEFAKEKSLDTVRECLQSKVTIEKAIIVRGDYGLDRIEFSIRNDLNWAVAGIWLSYSVLEEGRSVPWDEDDYPLSIDGGIEPGEVRVLGGHVELSRDSGENLIVIATVLDVADPKKRLLVGERGVFDWPDEKSTEICEQ